MLFLSTPSARRATTYKHVRTAATIISIHALREEGDGDAKLESSMDENFYPRPPRGGRPPAFCGLGSALVFLSTPSARRATYQVALERPKDDISIHALREEGDVL